MVGEEGTSSVRREDSSSEDAGERSRENSEAVGEEGDGLKKDEGSSTSSSERVVSPDTARDDGPGATDSRPERDRRR